jgi:hypothetical protein
MGHAARAGGPGENEERLKLSICNHLITGNVGTTEKTGEREEMNGGRRLFIRFDPWDTLKRSPGRDARTVPQALCRTSLHQSDWNRPVGSLSNLLLALCSVCILGFAVEALGIRLIARHRAFLSLRRSKPVKSNRKQFVPVCGPASCERLPGDRLEFERL